MPSKPDFDKVARNMTARPRHQGLDVHYLWINAHPDAPGRAALCSVPLSAVDMALENAARYKGARFTLWTDTALLDDTSGFMLQSHLYIANAPNFRLRSLQEIAEYRGDPEVFDPNHRAKMMAQGQKPAGRGTTIWGRVDYARLLILSHVLSEGAGCAIYSDLDNADLRLDAPRLHNRLKNHGLAFGMVKKDDGRVIYENGFMAVTEQRRVCNFLQEMIDDTRVAVSNMDNGYAVYRRAIGHYEELCGLAPSQKMLGVMSQCPPMGTPLRDKSLYIENGINSGQHMMPDFFGS